MRHWNRHVPLIALLGLIACEAAVLIAAAFSHTLLDYPGGITAFWLAFLGFALFSVASLLLLIAYALFSRSEIENRTVGMLALATALLWLPTIIASNVFSF